MIYEPSGKAREYSPLALNLYNGCGHGCVYCYVPNAIKMDRKLFDSGANPKKDIEQKLEKSCKKFANTEHQVLMSFATDPYNSENEKYNCTRTALELFLKYKIPVAILTKSKTVLNDLELIQKFGNHIKVGMSLTFTNLTDSLKYEKNASTPIERFRTLYKLKNNNIRTWASLEPVIDPAQTLEIIDITHDFVDEFQVGKVNHVKSEVDWHQFLIEVISKLRKYKKEFYIKNDLAKFAGEFQLQPEEIEMDRLTVKAFSKELELI